MSSESQRSQASAPHVVDVGAMLAPISGDRPAGEDLKFAGLHDEIKHARRADDGLGQGDWVRETKSADWEKAAALASDALAGRTKDLQVCAWMAEALVNLHGIVGLRDALRVVRGLHEQFWDDLFPEVEDGDVEGRANIISSMQELTADALKGAPLTITGLDYIAWEESNAFNVGPDVDSDVAEARKARAEKEGKVTSEDWLKAKQATPRAFYETAHATLGECVSEVAALDADLDRLYGNDAPSLADLKKSLEAVTGVVERIVKEKRLIEPYPTDGSDGVAETPPPQPRPESTLGHVSHVGHVGHVGNVGQSAAAAGGPLRTRDDAVRQLAEVAAFFRKTEPHSPVSYLVERAIRWSDMSLAAWLESVIKEDSALKALRETLGVDSAAEKVAEKKD
jgi:type VI secretion system protein ImpA